MHLKIKIIGMSKGTCSDIGTFTSHTPCNSSRARAKSWHRKGKEETEEKKRIFPIGWIALFLAAIIVATPSETTVVTRRVAVGIPHRRSSRSPLPLLPFPVFLRLGESLVSRLLQIFSASLLTFPSLFPFFSLPLSLSFSLLVVLHSHGRGTSFSFSRRYLQYHRFSLHSSFLTWYISIDRARKGIPFVRFRTVGS